MNRIETHASRQPRAAFTLVELLVVIGIIALLISILLPSLNKAREQARGVACLSGIRQAGNALAMYIGENKGWMPPYRGDVQDPGTYTSPSSGLGFSTGHRYALVTLWWAPGQDEDPVRDGDGFMGRYIGNKPTGKMPENGLGCPSVESYPTPTRVMWNNNPLTIYPQKMKTYALNYVPFSYDEIGNYVGLIRSNKVKNPGELVFMAEGIGGFPAIYTSYGDLFDFPQNWTYATPTPRHNNRFSMLFVDGHGALGTLKEDYQRFGTQRRMWFNE